MLDAVNTAKKRRSSRKLSLFLTRPARCHGRSAYTSVSGARGKIYMHGRAWPQETARIKPRRALDPELFPTVVKSSYATDKTFRERCVYPLVASFLTATPALTVLPRLLLRVNSSVRFSWPDNARHRVAKGLRGVQLIKIITVIRWW